MQNSELETNCPIPIVTQDLTEDSDNEEHNCKRKNKKDINMKKRIGQLKSLHPI